jgi:hypothetical protein
MRARLGCVAILLAIAALHGCERRAAQRPAESTRPDGACIVDDGGCCPEEPTPGDCMQSCNDGFICSNGECMSGRYWNCRRDLFRREGEPDDCGLPTE